MFGDNYLQKTKKYKKGKLDKPDSSQSESCGFGFWKSLFNWEKVFSIKMKKKTLTYYFCKK